MSFHQKKSHAGDGDARLGHAADDKTWTLPTLANERSDPEGHLTVSSNWTNRIPVSEAELVVLELYLADAINQLIGPKQKRGKGTSQARGPPQCSRA
jgi:hypothetical protein